MSEQLSNEPRYDQSNQTVIGPQINVAGNFLDARGIYANLTVQALLNACQVQVKGVLDDVRYKYDPNLYVHREIEAELNDFFDQPLADPSRNCYLIIAPAGSGKTNLLCDLARVRVRQQPVMLILGGSAYLSGAAGLLSTLQSELEAATPAVSFRSPSDSLHMLHQLAGQLDRDTLLLVDAINEHDQPAQMRKAMAELLRHTRNQRVKLVITCRDFYWNLFKGPFWDEATVNTLPTDEANEEEWETDHEDGQADFYHFAAIEQAQALTLYLRHYAINGKPVGPALEQCRHPLLLRFFCEAYRGQEIGEVEDIRLKELFDRYWDQKLRSIAERRLHQGEERLQAGLINEVATYLLNVAGYMLHRNERAILLANLSEATHVTEETFNPRSLYGRVRDEFIILEEQERGKGKRKTLQVAFVYEEFMEYVMARALLQAWDDQNLDNAAILAELDKLTQSYHHFSQILGVMVYLAIMLKKTRNLAFWSLLIDSGEAWRNVVFEAFKKLPADQLDAQIYVALFDMLTQGNADVQTQVLDLLKIKRIGRGISTNYALFTAVSELAVHWDHKLARRATLALQYDEDVRGIPIYIQNLGHGRADVRQNAINVLIGSGTEAVEPLITALKDNNAQIRRAASDILGHVGDARAIEPLIAALKDNDAQVQQAASVALRQRGTEAVEPLITALKDNNAQIRRAASDVLGHVGDVRAIEPLITTLKDNDAQVRLAASVALRRIGAYTVEPLITALKDNDTQIRLKAINLLEELGDARAIEPLIAALKDNNAQVQQAASVALGHIGDARAIEPLITALKDNNAQIRRAASDALGHVGDVRAIEPLITTLKDNDAQVQQAASVALRQRGTEAVEPLITALKDNNAQIRRAASDILRQMGTTAVEPLIIALKDNDAQVRLAASKILRRMGATAVKALITMLKARDNLARLKAINLLGLLGDARAVRPLLAIIKDKDAQVRQAASDALGQLDDKRAVEPLIAILKDKDSQVRQRAIAALERLGDARAIEPLIATLKDKDTQVRQASSDVLRRMGATAIKPLIAALKDNDDQVRLKVIYLLGQLDDARAAESLIALLKNKDNLIRLKANDILRQMGTTAVEPLIAALKDNEAQVRRAAVNLLGQMGDTRAVEPVIAALKDNDAQVRQAATEALRRMGTTVVEPLITLCKDNDAQVHQVASDALGQLGDARAVEPLIAALKDNNAQSQQCAIAVLNQSNETRTVELLIAALHDENVQVRQEAIDALGRLGDSRAVDPIIAALEDENYTVRWSASHALRQLGDIHAVAPLIAAYDRGLIKPQPIARALAKFQQQDLQVLESRLNDPDATIRQRTQQLLDLIQQARAETTTPPSR